MKKITTEESAINLLRDGNEEAFEFLFNRYYHKIFHFVNINLHDTNIAEDITSECFYKLWKHRERLVPEKGIDGLLFIIARNLVYNHTNQQIKRDLYYNRIIKEMQDIDDSQNINIESSLNAKLLLELIDQWIEELPEQRKKIFLMSRKENMQNKDIANKLGISPKTVETQIRRSIQFLKEKLDHIYCFLM